MADDICNERHLAIKEKLSIHDARINNHSGRIDKLEQNDTANAVRVNNLCDQLANLVVTIRWSMGFLVGGFITFFFYAAQKGLIK